MIRISIDRGGTFTDVYASNGREEIVIKLLSVDPTNYKDAPTEGIRRVIEHFTESSLPRHVPINLSGVESIRMGTTVATNALLERKGERVAFLVTKGFKDILRIGQQARPDIFDLKVKKLDKIYESVYEIDERVTILDSEYLTGEDLQDEAPDKDNETVTGVSGEKLEILKKPDMQQINDILMEIWDSGIRSVAISLMHSFTYPDHENIVAEAAKKVGFVNISVSHKLQPMIKIVSRANSSTADAYLSPITTRYIHEFGGGFKGGLDSLSNKLLFMQSDGGLTSWEKFSGLKAILSGPAGGVVGYAKTSFTGTPVLGFDMGGTSTDVSRYNGTLEHIFETVTAQVTIQSPQLDVSTVAAGGGSMLFWRKGLFVVGPESAGAHPGPACYRKGGPLTVTDANLFLGRIVPDYFPKIFGPNENESLDVDIVQRKFMDLKDQINREGHQFTAEQVAMGFLSVANEAMCRPIRSLSEGKGYNTANHELASFGGAGGQHACAIAAILGIKKVIIHKYSSILSAYGMALADVVEEAQLPESTILNDDNLPYLEAKLDRLEQATLSKLKERFKSSKVIIERYLNLKYRGTETFVMTTSPYMQNFVQHHNNQFGFSLDRDIIVGDIRVRVVGVTEVNDNLLPQMCGETHIKQVKSGASTRVYFENFGWVDAQIYTIDDLGINEAVKGPALIIDKTQTLVISPGALGTSLRDHIVIDIEPQVQSTSIESDKTFKINPIDLSIFANRFMSIAEQMGKTLQLTAISTNIKERLDFSCALFNPSGGLVANAPHIPVHLGSMSAAVKFQIDLWGKTLEEGDVLMANHPAYGGSHLPDITIITPVFGDDGKEIMFWVASRGHQSDVGGITAGSMPPFSKTLYEEGAIIKGFKIVKRFEFDEAGVVDLLYTKPSQYPGCSGSRSLSDCISDLKAQIAANHKGIELLRSLISEFSLPVVQMYMDAIQDNAEGTVRALLKGMPCTHLEAVDKIDCGTEIHLSIDIDRKTGSAKFDFTGTGPQIEGNLNAPRAITYSAILYAIRSMVRDAIPLNQGCLMPLEVIIPKGTLLDPSPEAAIVGGNVETSQRITDVVLQAFGAMAASQGTCNNLTFGCEKFGYYETIAGGAGAGPDWEGQSGVQVHMTNTRSTDPEILEKRYPCILREFSLRTGSGGKGLHRGGDGVVRDIEFKYPLQVSILSERRDIAPYGMNGGGSGAKGENYHYRSKTGDYLNIGGKNSVKCTRGDRIVIKTPGGGGYGTPSE